jgi:MFS family permease
VHPYSSGDEGDLRPLVRLIAGNVLFATGLSFHGFLYNFYLEALGHAEGVMGQAAAALTLGGLASLLPAGWLADRAGPRRSLVLAGIVVTVGLAAGALAERPLPVYLAAVVAGIGFGLWRVTLAPALMRLTEPARRPRAFAWNVGLLVASSGVWVALAGSVPDWLVAGLDLERLPAIRVALLLGAGGSALSTILFALLPRFPMPRTAPAPGAAGFKPVLAVLPIVGFVWLWMLGPALAAPFFNIFFTRRFALSVMRVGMIFAAANLLWGAIVFGSGDVAARVGRVKLLAVALAFFAPAMWGLSLASSAGFAVGLFLLQGAVSPIANPLIDQLLLERVPAARHGLVSSWRNAAADLSAMAGASAGGWLLADSTFSTLLVGSGIVGLAGAVGLVLALRVAPRLSASVSTASGP